MNETRRRSLLRILWVASVGVAFLLGVILAGHRFKKSLPRLCNTFTYSDCVHNAANYAHILLAARRGDTSAVIRTSEKSLDASLLVARGSTDALMRVIEKGPWTELKTDRMEHPREQTTPERDTRINEMLDLLIKEQPQQSAAPLPPAPRPGPSEGAR
jgi:hypothetical protein